MPNCNNCGKYIQPTEVLRREIYVGKTRRINYGKRISFGNSNYYRKQNVCYECSKAIDEANERSRNTTWTIIIVIAIFIVLYLVLKK
jgi:predicted nucleic acid-binding Zn ribbon protein